MRCSAAMFGKMAVWAKVQWLFCRQLCVRGFCMQLKVFALFIGIHVRNVCNIAKRAAAMSRPFFVK